MLLEILQIYSGLTLRQLERYAETASSRYKVYPIPKRDGGQRIIAQPSRRLKSLQRLIVRELFQKFQVHGSATAYSEGASIRKNAHMHAFSNFTLHTDFEDFFPSFHGEGLEVFLTEQIRDHGIHLTPADISFIRRVVCRYNALTIGAPSSPCITNALMFDFDVAISNWCSGRGLVYTRYADDIYVSGLESNSLSDALSTITVLSKRFPYANLAINQDKVAFLSRRYLRKITGLVITPTHAISVGRDRKIEIKSKLYKFSKNELSNEDILNLRGHIAFIKDVEHSFYTTLERKYGLAMIERLYGNTC